MKRAVQHFFWATEFGCNLRHGWYKIHRLTRDGLYHFSQWLDLHF